MHRKHFIKPSVGSRIDWGHPLSKNLVGCWLMNEGAGTRTRDLARNNDGILKNGPVWTGGKFGQALSFDGSNDYFEAPVSVEFSGAWSFVIRAQFIGTPALKSLLRVTGLTTTPLNVFWWNSGNGMLMQRGASSNSAQATELASNPNINNEHTYFFVYDGSSARALIYVDAINLSANGSAGLSSDADTKIARIAARDPDFYANMSAQWLFAYSRTLSPAEIAELYGNPFAFIKKPSSNFAKNPLLYTLKLLSPYFMVKKEAGSQLLTARLDYLELKKIFEKKNRF